MSLQAGYIVLGKGDPVKGHGKEEGKDLTKGKAGEVKYKEI